MPHMTRMSLHERGPFRGHSPSQQRPLGGYAALTGSFGAAVLTFSAWFARSGRRVPERMATGDVVLVAVATHKASRLLSKSRAASTIRAPFTEFQDDAGPGEVSEAARGQGLQRAVGELLVCPYCLGMWFAAAFTGGLLVAPRATRHVAGVCAALFGSDMLQIAYKKAEDAM